jgi:hypothetical protein
MFNISQLFYIENNGFYEIYNLNLTTVIQKLTGTLVLCGSTVVRLIQSGRRIDLAHNVSLSLKDITSAGLSDLLFNDTNLEIEMSAALIYADIIPITVSTNYSMPWGAPLYHMTIENASITPQNATDVRVILPFSFENHSFFDLNGTMHTEIINTQNLIVGTSTTPINAPPKNGYSTRLEFLVPSESANTLKEVQIYFNTSVLSYGPVVIPLARE